MKVCDFSESLFQDMCDGQHGKVNIMIASKTALQKEKCRFFISIDANK